MTGYWNMVAGIYGRRAELESERAKARQEANLKKGNVLPSGPRGPDGESGRTAEIISKKLGADEAQRLDIQFTWSN